ncbi:hypothetical protein BFW38_12170 [Terasakiispira papahanaumokuakeensis]|uniref:Flagellar biosynthesis protein FlaG n=1 Tax=Terasakiispira papahanaumokuakeensis TaxID=197479 RepID=A0A1E2VAX5_9GAMM|nr:flagellar protein FlaG [Terasakiispira papahanaumokuakeensis]ODC04169.1 hypothetical protein BFW38_12170 [Terasakiispira papahanaumokuakeensis]
MTSSSLNNALSGTMAQENLRSTAQRASHEKTPSPHSPKDVDQLKSTERVDTEAMRTQGHLEQQTRNAPQHHDIKHDPSDGQKASALASDTPQALEAQEDEVSEEQAPKLAQQLSELNNVMYALNRKIKFEIDDTTEALIVRVINKETNEIIRQYPKDEILERMERLLEGDTGSFSAEIE